MRTRAPAAAAGVTVAAKIAEDGVGAALVPVAVAAGGRGHDGSCGHRGDHGDGGATVAVAVLIVVGTRTALTDGGVMALVVMLTVVLVTSRRQAQSGCWCSRRWSRYMCWLRR